MRICGFLSALLAGFAAFPAPAFAELRIGLQAAVVERCALAGVDAGRLDEGLIQIRTNCNAERYSVRLVLDGRPLALEAAEAAGAGVELVERGALVTQARPGLRTIAVRLSEPEALAGRLQVRIETV